MTTAARRRAQWAARTTYCSVGWHGVAWLAWRAWRGARPSPSLPVPGTPHASPQRGIASLTHVERVQLLLKMHLRRSRLEAAFKLGATLEAARARS